MNVRSIGNHRLYLEKQQQTYEWGFLDTVVHNVILGNEKEKKEILKQRNCNEV